jgi:hypothetical protein
MIPPKTHPSNKEVLNHSPIIKKFAGAASNKEDPSVIQRIKPLSIK